MRRDLRWDESWQRLREWTGSSGAAERLAAQVLQDQGFTNVDPSHPLGGKDGKADALATRDGMSWVMAVYFPRGQQRPTEITNKFKSDCAGVVANGGDAFAFVTNQEVRRSERKSLEDSVRCRVEIFHLERVVAVLDQPRMHAVRQQFLGIQSDGLDRDERLDELWRESIGRCEARWISVGLPETEAAELATGAEVGRVEPELCPDLARPLIVWTAPMGSGKSIGSERHHQQTLEEAVANEDTPLPVFLRALDCVPDLRMAVEQAASELGEPRRLGAAVVIDGVDEVGHQAAAELLMQARTLVRTWPGTTVLMTSRAVPALTEAPEHLRLPFLSPEAQEECVRLGAGGQLWPGGVHAFLEPVRATLGQPLFALLAGLWVREWGTAPRASIDLLALLGDRATRGLDINQQQLRQLAVLSVARELGPVHPGDVLAGGSADELLATGMLVRRDDGLAFVLPAIAQWFAAQALLVEEIGPREILEAPEDLELWRYSLALALGLGSAERAEGILAPLLTANAGFAMRVLDTMFGQAVLGGATPPPWREGGRRIRQALEAVADALGPVAPLVLDTDEQGVVLPMGVASGKSHLTVAFWCGTESRPDVFPLPGDFSFLGSRQEWRSGKSAVVGPGGAWAWNWSLSKTRTAFTRLLKNRRLPIPPHGPLAEEAAWVAACDLLQENALLCDSIELERVVRALAPYEPSGYGPVILEGARRHDLRGLRHKVLEAQASGTNLLLPPVPPADQTPARGSGRIGEFYSDERIVLVATRVYESAVAGYRQLVERWLPTLADALEHYVLMPMHVIGFVSNGRETSRNPSGALPHLAGYSEALPDGSPDQVSMTFTTEPYDYEAAAHTYAQQRGARPQAARWLSGRHGGMRFELGGRFPISDVVYDWIASDLKRIGLVGPFAASRSRDAFVSWDLSASR